MLTLFIISTGLTVAPEPDHVTLGRSGHIEKGQLKTLSDGTPASHALFVILQMPDSSITAHGAYIGSQLTLRGLVTQVLSAQDAVAQPQVLADAVIILDASLGGDEGQAVDQNLIRTLLSYDRPALVLGRASWVLHRLRETTKPTQTALLDTTFQPTPEHGGAVYLSSPFLIPNGITLTSESSLELPVDSVVTEYSALVNLTEADPSIRIAPLRYDSWPLDMFLFGPEDPSCWTTEAWDLVVNLLAYMPALRESDTSFTVAGRQSSPDSPLAGGFSYWHQPTLDGTYYAVHSAKSVLNTTMWEGWRDSHQQLVQSVLSHLYSDLGSEACFKDQIDVSASLHSTAKGLWLVHTMGLTAQFDSQKLSSYVASRQDASGGFENDITRTWYSIEGLHAAGQVALIDTAQAEVWLRACVIDGQETSNPDLWGAIGNNPTSISPRSSYAARYVRSLQLIGKSHNDPLKLTSWFITRMMVGDGSFREQLGMSTERVAGTSAALSTMAIMGTLSTQNRTRGLEWFALNQHDSGGFSITAKSEDILPKGEQTALVASCLFDLNATGAIGEGIIGFVNTCESPVGFELVEPLPSLMWTYWLTLSARATHSSDLVDLSSAADYLTGFSTWAQYPTWANITAYPYSPEYRESQYRIQSVWTQYFGIGSAQVLKMYPTPLASSAATYALQSQDSSGHFRLTNVPIGTPHMQYTAAAVEVLYTLGFMNSITYRDELNAAVLAAYQGGMWSGEGWTLRPFSGHQTAIDFLSMRAALRLGLIDSIMASEILTVIQTRVQYNDLWALSLDVSSVALLVSAGLVSPSALQLFNSSEVLDAVSAGISNGWFNSTTGWQPVFTADVLRMVSILGLRTRMVNATGSTLDVTFPLTATLGQAFSVSLNISSASPTHTVFVNAFGSWTEYTGLSSLDVISVPVPYDASLLGSQRVSLVVSDVRVSRSFAASDVEVRSSLAGDLTVETPTVMRGELVNGTATWYLEGGAAAGPCQVTVRLGEPPVYREWNYATESPLHFSVSTDDMGDGAHPITVTVQRTHCDMLVLSDVITVLEPLQTEIVTQSSIEGVLGDEISIPWTLRLVSNGSAVASQNVTIKIWDSADQLVHSDSAVSTYGESVFVWSPLDRGEFTFTIYFARNGSLESSSASGQIVVAENTAMLYSGPSVVNQYSTADMSLRLIDSRGYGLSGMSVHAIVLSPSAQVVFDAQLTTNATGYVMLLLELGENGEYTVTGQFLGSVHLLGSDTTVGIVSWSSTTITVGGVMADSLVSQSYRPWARLTDSAGTPLVNSQIQLRIVFLPDIQVVFQSLATNSTGHVSWEWVPNSAGSYLIRFEYPGSLSRGAASGEMSTETRLPVTISLSPMILEVGEEEAIALRANDHMGQPVQGLLVEVMIVREGVTVHQATGTTGSDGWLVVIWTPDARGPTTVTAQSARQGVYEAAMAQRTTDVYEQADFQLEWSNTLEAVSNVMLQVTIVGFHGVGIEGVNVSIRVELNGAVLVDTLGTTTQSGTLQVQVGLEEPGSLSVALDMPDQDCLRGLVNTTVWSVRGRTTLALLLSGNPITQGTTLGIVAQLVNWQGTPMVGYQVTLSVQWANGTLRDSVVRTTGTGGTCSLAHYFDEVGDFILTAQFGGEEENAPSSCIMVQRVRVTPNLVVQHDLTVLLGSSIQIQVGLTDALGRSVVGRSIVVAIWMDDEKVFEAGIVSLEGLAQVTWYPSARGVAQVTATHTGDTYYLDNSTSSTLSVMEIAEGVLELSSSTVNLFDNLSITYEIQCPGEDAGVSVRIQVLDVNLVPVWTYFGLTDANGTLRCMYLVQHSRGTLMVRAGPTEGQFLLGADAEIQFMAVSECVVTTDFLPDPPTLATEVYIEVMVFDQLGVPISGMSVTVALRDPFGNPVRLGALTQNVVVTLQNGLATVPFTPSLAGLYRVTVSSSGTPSTHAFTVEEYHVVYSPTFIQILNVTQTIEVGGCLNASISLSNSSSLPMADMTLVVMVDGPGSLDIGPVTLVTGPDGWVTYSVAIPSEGEWILEVSFSGLGIHLPSSGSVTVDVRFGTQITVAIVEGSAPLAGTVPLVLTALLQDTEGAVLEGRQILYDVYHDEYGLVLSGGVTQRSSLPENISILIQRMGNYTVLVRFEGTEHYHASSVAVTAFVRGTTSINAEIPESLDRSDLVSAVIEVLDETGVPLDPTGLEIEIVLSLASGPIDLGGRLVFARDKVLLNLTGLLPDDYSVSVRVQDTAERLGCVYESSLVVTSRVALEVVQAQIPGLLSHDHRVVVLVSDSLGSPMSGHNVLVSLFNPTGAEVYGNPLTTQTQLVVSSLGTVEVAWRPSQTGTYRLVIVFQSTGRYLNATTSLDVLTRHEALIDLDAPQATPYDQRIHVSVTLRTSLAPLVGVSVRICFLSHGVLRLNQTASTNTLGTAAFSVEGLLADEYMLVAYYEGSESIAPADLVANITVTPVKTIDIEQLTPAYVGENTSLSLTIRILGVDESWRGSMHISVYDVNDSLVLNRSVQTYSNDRVVFSFIPLLEGQYRVSAWIGGVPVDMEYLKEFKIIVTTRPLSVTLDAATSPVAYGGLVLGIVALVLRVKLKSGLAALPTDWE
ncbi:MAG: hypothetical protein HXY34_05630 [Candidatus Thorarchaeota archaeon]|nr:hypothetical protein [Candidatus Thorarchaeota archaeon]